MRLLAAVRAKRLADRKDGEECYSMRREMITLDAYVADTLMRDLVGHDRRPSAFLVYLSLATAAGAVLSHAQMAERTGLSKRSVQAGLAHLERRGLVRIERRGPTDVLTLTALTPWRR